MSRFFGPLLQYGFVVHDWRAAAEHWTRNFGVGPFFVLEHVPFARCLYKGAPAELDLTVAIAYSGEQQIELVQQHNDAPSIFTDFSRGGRDGLQHVGVLTGSI
ncbi:MAG: VOC family protein, partial [Steroidobacteraceae bacterium]|nr:VOC family protein [Steroidobacteraceae bacterium]